jgi:hypothetical protein
LAYWFPSLSDATGSQSVSSVSSVDFTDWDPGVEVFPQIRPLTTHSYLKLLPYSDILPAWQQIKGAFEMKEGVLGRRLLWTTWILTGWAALPPLFDFFPSGLRLKLTHPGAILRFIFGVYAWFWFFLWGLGKIICLILAMLVVVVFVNPTIPPRTRLATAAAGSAACCLLCIGSASLSINGRQGYRS